MSEDAKIAQKREELKYQLATGEYKTLVDMILDGTGRVIQKLFRNQKPVSFWVSGLVIALVTSLLAILPPLIAGEFNSQWMIIEAEISAVGVALVVIISVRLITRLLFTTWHDHLIDAVESVVDLANLQRWLVALNDVKKPFIFSLIYSIFIGVVPFIDATSNLGFIGIWPILVFLIAFFQGGLAIYYLALVLVLSIGLRQYHFKLYAVDPRSSEVIDHLSDLLTAMVYIVAINMAIATLSFWTTLSFVFTLNLAITLILVWWIPLTVFFVINQDSLRRIITRAKWKTLNRIQAKIEELQGQENITDKETMETINRLVTYHDQIKGTSDSALSLRVGLNFINSLLLPPLAFILANLEIILGFF